MSLRKVACAAALVLAAASMAAPASASLMQGKTLGIEYLYPDLGTDLVLPQDITGGGPGVSMFIGSDLTVTLGDHTIDTSEDDFAGGYYNPTSFNGLHIWDAHDTVADFTGVKLLHNDYPGFDMSRVTFDADNIYINLTGLPFQVSPSELKLAVTGGVPELATWTLMIGGFGMAGAMLRRRRAVPARA